MTLPPLCIIQARYRSTRLPGKMLRTLPYREYAMVPSTTGGLVDRVPMGPGEKTLIARGHRIAVDAFGRENVVVAIPATDEPGPLGEELRRIGATVFAWDGPENDVLGRFYHCAHTYRWHPDTVIVRYTPDDPFKKVHELRRVAGGERLPVEIGGEACTLRILGEAMQREPMWFSPVIAGDEPVFNDRREHITHALFPTLPPPLPPPGQIWTVDTEDDLQRARARAAAEIG